MSNCKNSNCNKGCDLCADSALHIPATFSNNPTVCTTKNSCSEIFDAECVCYNGPDICEFDIKKGDKLTKILQKLLLITDYLACNPGSSSTLDNFYREVIDDVEVVLLSDPTLYTFPSATYQVLTFTNPNSVNITYDVQVSWQSYLEFLNATVTEYSLDAAIIVTNSAGTVDTVAWEFKEYYKYEGDLYIENSMHKNNSLFKQITLQPGESVSLKFKTQSATSPLLKKAQIFVKQLSN